MACDCPDETRSLPPEPRTGTRHEVLSDGQVVYRTPDAGKAEKVAERWPGGTIRKVDNKTPHSNT